MEPIKCHCYTWTPEEVREELGKQNGMLKWERRRNENALVCQECGAVIRREEREE